MEEAVIEDFRALINVELQQFMDASQALGEPIFGFANMVRRAFRNLLSFIIDGVTMERPNEERVTRMIELLSNEIRDIQSFRDRNRQITAIINHLSTVSDSIFALNWITMYPSPVQFVHDSRDAAQYYGNRVLSQYKGDQHHQEWINKWYQVLSALETYVRNYHRTGFNWNIVTKLRVLTRPTPAGDASTGLVSMGLPPPPPPPPVMGLIPEGGDTRQNLLRDLNQGVGIVQMLKPVNKEKQSQSQQSLPSTSGENLPRTPAAARTYPPKLLLDGQKWRVEHQKDRFDLVIDSAEMSHSLAVFKCQNIGLEVKNKLNNVTIDNCKRTTVVVKDIISCVEIIGGQDSKLQCIGHVPLISLDNCDCMEIYLSKESFGAEIFSSKSTSLNVSLMKENGDYVEMAVPEQIKTVIVDGKLVSTAVEKK